jgi:hypothetical protein
VKRLGSERVSPPTRGSSIAELLVALLVLGLVLVMALAFLRAQNLGFRRGLDGMTSVQNLRKAMGTLDRDIQTAGIHLAPGQPPLVYGDGDVLAFNADFASRDSSDPLAVLIDPSLEEEATSVLPEERRQRIGGSSFFYPARTYMEAPGRPGSAETIIFFFQPDLQTPRPDDFVLFRQVNSLPPTLVADRLFRADGVPFFRYLRVGETGIDSIPEEHLPLTHGAPGHGSPEDTGAVSLVDSVRAVRIALAGTSGRAGEQERTWSMARIVPLPNVGLEDERSCGTPPVPGPGISASLGRAPTGERVVELTWTRARDEAEGERDVVRYVIWRRQPGITDWGTPYLSVPAGMERYRYADGDVLGGASYQYALAAQDCTPAVSPRIATAIITVPLDEPLEVRARRVAPGAGSGEGTGSGETGLEPGP